ncbi:MAG: pilus assembly protein N-terminal domain-containing protein, partial [Desulfobacterales bacterium]|nr:pilus assembly protein N-terminal domain-containing protein [Desulfobacterales bacterium]
MTTLLRFNKITLIVLFFLIFISVGSHAQNNLVPETMEPPKIDIILGKSIVMKSEINVKRISIGSPEIADFILLSPKEIYLKGLAAGLTNMMLWQEGNNIPDIYDLEVKYDLSRLKEKLYQILPDEKEIRIMSTQDSLTLSGRVSSAENLSQAMVLAA